MRRCTWKLASLSLASVQYTCAELELITVAPAPVGAAGADIATMPYDVFVKLVKHPLTDVGLQKFTQDWQVLQRDLKGGA